MAEPEKIKDARISDLEKDIQLLKSKNVPANKNASQDTSVMGSINASLQAIDKAQYRLRSNIKKANMGTQVILILMALGFLLYAFGFRYCKVYDKPAAANNGKLSTFNRLTHARLMEELSYDAIIRDSNGNLINKGREAHCLT